ncbi:MAG: ATP-binding cassette domain-containing protein [Pseudomonadota bacterium]
MSRLPLIAAGGRGRLVAAVAALALGQAAAAAAAAFATRDLFALLRAPGASLADAAPALAALGLAGAATGLFRVGERVTAERAGQRYAAALRLRLFRHLGRLSARQVARRRAGSLSMRFVGDLAAIRGWVGLGVARLITAAIVVPAAAAALFALDPRLALAGAAPVAAALGLMAWLGPRLGRAHGRLRRRNARLAAEMSERAAQAPELRLMGRMRRETELLERRARQLEPAAAARARGRGTMRAIPDAASGLAAALLLAVALREGVPGPDAAGALAALALMIQPVRDLAGVWDRRRAWLAARAAVERILDEPPPARPRRRAARGGRLASAPHPLRLRVRRAGPLGRLDVTVPAGARVAITGPNGSGKSTLLALAAGLEDPGEGRVTLGGRDVRALSAAERRRLIGFVGPRAPILAGSLRRALTLGAVRRPQDDEVLARAREFGLEGVLARLGGLDGRVAEAGRNLSSGESRRLLLARAALVRPRLLLLDEPDDTLDSEARGLIAGLLDGVDATVILVTHDPQIAELADEVWRIEEGRLHCVGQTRPATAELTGSP